MRNVQGARECEAIRQSPNHRRNGHAQRSIATRSSRHRSPPSELVWLVSAPQVSQGGGWPVMRPLNPQMSGNPLSEFRIDRGHARLPIHREKLLLFGKRFKFFFYFSLIHDEGLEQI